MRPTQFLYRWLAYSKWLFVDIESELMWRRKDDREVSPGISLRVEALFGGPYLKKLEERVEGKSDR